MAPFLSPFRQRFLVPEVVQTSAMDCGPAVLKALFEGFGLPISYGRLRDICLTDLDGTSIDTLESVAAGVGLAAEQVMVPLDHLFLPAARSLPAVVVVRQPNGLAHFVLAWRCFGRWVEVMDPAAGRQWVSRAAFLSRVHVHRAAVPAAEWREWAGSEDFTTPLRARLRGLGLARGFVEKAIADGASDHGWQGLASLDACARLLASLVHARAAPRGAARGRLLSTLWEKSRTDGDTGLAVPEGFWMVRPAPARTATDERLSLEGVVLVRVRGWRRLPAPSAGRGLEGEAQPVMAAALQEGHGRPGRELGRLLLASGRVGLLALFLGLVLAGCGVAFEGLLWRGFLDIGRDVATSRERLMVLAGLLAFGCALLLLDLPLALGTLRVARQLEIRLRLDWLRKVPRLADRYLKSRLSSDLAERSHSVHRLRQLPELGETTVRTALELAFTVAGILWLDPAAAPVALATLSLVLVVPTLFLPSLAEKDLRLRTHAGALTRFYLEALLGLLPIRTHGAEGTVRREHESLLVKWADTHLELQRRDLIADLVTFVATTVFIISLLAGHASRRFDGGELLLFYWAFNLQTLAHMLTLMLALQTPPLRNLALRLLEPLRAPEEGEAGAVAATAAPSAGMALAWRGVSVRASGHTILESIDLEVPPGSEVAIVGPSGAGKSTLVGSLLGWHRPEVGTLLVDGEPLTRERLPGVRAATAWVDPGVQLWNRSLLSNLRYGHSAAGEVTLAEVVRRADLMTVLERLPVGFETPLGEGGCLLSGGEGQRVRFARALLAPGVRLVILDEPFRGLDRSQRARLLSEARARWQGATLLAITHDVSETLGFPRVVVVDGGRVVEEGVPAQLAVKKGSRYAALLTAERDVRSALWDSPLWRRMRMAEGRLTEVPARGGDAG